MDETTTRKTPGTWSAPVPAREWACLVMLHGPFMGRKWDVGEGRVTIGRDERCTIVVDSDTVSRVHAAIELVGKRREIVDLDSTNGTTIDNVPVLGRAVVHSGSVVSVGSVIFKYLTGDNIEAQYYDQVFQIAVIDALTQVPNRRQSDAFLGREMARARRHDRRLTVMMLDIDNFKEVNDRHGHVTGDQVLRLLAAAIQGRMRGEDLFARYGGEEFVFILPETDLAAGLAVAESIRGLVEGLPLAAAGVRFGVTVSIGVVEFSKDAHVRPEDLIKAADDLLYAAKRAGRNRVCS